MFFDLFFGLKAAGLPVSLREYLTLVEGVRAGVADHDVDRFYFLARATLVKDERHLDRFDRVFAEAFKGLERAEGTGPRDLPEDWLRKLMERFLTPEEKAQVQALGGFDKLMETLRQRLAEQKERHQGGSKWVGTGGTSPFGAWGYNPEGVRIGQTESRNRRAVKVWDQREFANLDLDAEITSRSMKLALRRLRRFARSGRASELDLDGTVRATADNAGWLDLKLKAPRGNTVKVLLLLDIGGSMDDHVELCAELFSAARSEFKHLEFFYFHNCPYEGLWRDNRRRHAEKTPVFEILRRYGQDWRLVFVGDAAMSPYEILYPGGSVEHWNEEAGRVWMERLTGHFRAAAWLNPQPERRWSYSESNRILSQLMEGRMYPLTLAGLDRAMAELLR